MRLDSPGARICLFITMSLPAVLLAGCGSKSSSGNHVGDPCGPDDPCPDPLVCSPEGTCIIPSDGGIDASLPDADSGSSCDPGQVECGTICCDQGFICFDENCILDQGACQTDAECQEDSYCYEGICIPYGLGPRGPFNPGCTRLSIAGLFQPSIQCEWLGPPAGDPYPNHVQVLSTPTVIDFDLDDDPGTIQPSIVLMTYDGLDGDSGYYNGAYGVVRVLDGATCEQLYNVGTQLNGCNPPALGDLDGDGRADIAVVNGYGRLEVYSYDHNTDTWPLLFYGHDSGGTPVSWGTEHPTGWASLSIHDLDDDGLPEILSGGLVYNHEGLLLDSSLGLTGQMYSGAGYPVAADIDNDNLVELVTGSGVFEFDVVNKRWVAEWTGGPYQGFVAVADFGSYDGPDASTDDRLMLDGIAEIGVIRSGQALVMNRYGRVVFGPISLPGSSGGGPPTIGDFDGDSLPELASAGSDSYTVFDPDCRGLPDINRCHSLRTDGILWSQDSQDYSSNVTGSSLFDFEGDGKVEAIYRDEVFARVYDGRTGEVVFSSWSSSCTWNENPIVADVDGDFNAELLVPSNRNCGTSPRSDKGWSFSPSTPFYEVSHRGYYMDPLFRGIRCKENGDCMSGVCDAGYCRCTTDDECGGAGSGFVCDHPPNPPMSPTPGAGNTCRAEWLGSLNGVRVYRDVMDRWVGSRTVWNQHTYSVTNVGEDGTIPATSSWTRNWLEEGLNNFRQNVQGDPNSNSSPDLTGGQGALAACQDNSAILTLRVCNRGTDPVAQGVPVTFYDGQPADGQVICTVATSEDLFPGQCTEVECTWQSPPPIGAPRSVTVVVDDDGTGSSVNSECEEGNNRAVIPEVGCLIVG